MHIQKLLAGVLAGLLLATPGCTPKPAPASAGGTAVTVDLGGGQVTVDGAAASRDSSAAIYVGADIVYYQAGAGETYGEGTEEEQHTPEEAAAHTVVTITQPGTYRLTGTLPKGQVAVDLGEEAKDDPQAVVTLLLDNVSVTCTVAPALIFYNVYECDRDFLAHDRGEDTDYQASATVDTSAAGANVVIAAGSVNTFQGSHVARIYKEGTTDKLHKYDGAFYSRMSMNVNGDNGDDSGVLNIVADNEGLDSELHLTLNGGTIHIQAQNDGINTNEDLVSVTTVNGGTLTVNAGLGAEGDGIDSNGFLVINGGSVYAMSNERSADGGIDAECPILLNGGTVSAFGVRNDTVDAASAQPYMELSFASALSAGSVVELKDGEGKLIWSATLQKACQSITLADPALALDTPYQLTVDGVAQGYTGTGNSMGRPGGQRGEGMEEPPEGFQPTERGEGMEEPPEGFQPGQRPGRGEGGKEWPGGMEEPSEGFQPTERPEGMEEPPEGFDPGQRPEQGEGMEIGAASTEFTLTTSVKSFSGVRAALDAGGAEGTAA